ncbi:hypothetical protein Tco_0104505 [Tanacetum coccineum]
MQKPPLFEANGFIYWKNRFKTYVKSKDIDLWHIIVNGDYKRTFRNTSTGRDETLPYERLTKKVSSDEEASCLDSDDEEYAMAVRDFKKFFRRRGKFVRQPHDEKKAFRKAKEENKGKAFVGGAWSDSKDDEDLKKDEICFMAHYSNEVSHYIKLRLAELKGVKLAKTVLQK